MRWIVGLITRFFWFGIAWFAFTTSFCCVTAGADLGAEGLWRMVRTTTFLVTTGMLAFEVLRLRAVLSTHEPSRKRSGLLGVLAWVVVFFGSFAGWALWFLATSPMMQELMADSVLVGLWLLVMVALAWSAVSVGVLALVTGGGRLLWLRLRGRTKAGTPPVYPWIVASLCAGSYGLSAGFIDVALVLALLVVYFGLLILDEQNRRTEPVELLVTLQPGRTESAVHEAFVATHATADWAFPGSSPGEDARMESMLVVTVPSANRFALELLLLIDPDVVDIQLDAAVASDPHAAGGQCSWGVRRLLPVDDPLASGQTELVQIGGADAISALDKRRPKNPVVVALVDTGVDGAHPDLAGVLVPRPISDDRNGHGTAAAGAIAAVTHNGRGIATLNLRGEFLRVRSYPAMAGSRPSAQDVADAILRATDNGARVINLSLGARGDGPEIIRKAIAYAVSSDVAVVAAAGNDGEDASARWPANVDGVLVVGAVDERGRRASFSNTTRGVALAVSAPGQDVCTLGRDGGYPRFTGTSLAAPMVSGVIGAMLASCPSLRADEAIAILYLTGKPVSDSGLGPLVQADKAIAGIEQLHPECKPKSDSWRIDPWSGGSYRYEPEHDDWY